MDPDGNETVCWWMRSEIPMGDPLIVINTFMCAGFPYPSGASNGKAAAAKCAGGSCGGGNASPFKPPKRPCPLGEEISQVYVNGADAAAIALAQANVATFVTGRLVDEGILHGLNGGPADAFRHCYWSCIMSKAIGGFKAYVVGVIHEDCNSNNTDAEREMDIHNNWLGLTLGQPTDDCEEKCLNAVKRGLVKTLAP